MPVEETRTLNLETIPDAIALMNESSRGMSTEYHFDFFSFLVFKGYWNVSSNHSLVRYVNGAPAAIVLTCIDETARDAYILYWGAIPKFRTLQIARALFEACCDKLSGDGYRVLYGLSVPDRPVKRYRFIKAAPQFQLLDLQAEALSLPPSDEHVLVHPIDLRSLSPSSTLAGDRIEWSQRTSFLRRVASTLKCFAAFKGSAIKAYAIIRPDQAGVATLIDLRSSDTDLCWGQELLRHALIRPYSPPFMATNVTDQGYSYRLLIDAGFQVTRKFHVLSRDLRKTSSNSSTPAD